MDNPKEDVTKKRASATLSGIVAKDASTTTTTPEPYGQDDDGEEKFQEGSKKTEQKRKSRSGNERADLLDDYIRTQHTERIDEIKTDKVNLLKDKQYFINQIETKDNRINLLEENGLTLEAFKERFRILMNTHMLCGVLVAVGTTIAGFCEGKCKFFGLALSSAGACIEFYHYNKEKKYDKSSE